LKVPENLLYTKEHEWIRKKDNVVKVGITDFAQSQLGDIIFLELPEVGDQIVAGESFGEIEAVKTVSELYAPIDGTILEVNEELEDSPDNINQDCYGAGWIIKVSHEGDLESNDLLDHKAYSNLIE
jgi:glycine cleavage system H protein